MEVQSKQFYSVGLQKEALVVVIVELTNRLDYYHSEIESLSLGDEFNEKEYLLSRARTLTDIVNLLTIAYQVGLAEGAKR